MSTNLSKLKKSLNNNTLAPIALSSVALVQALSIANTPTAFAESYGYSCFYATFEAGMTNGCDTPSNVLNNEPVACVEDNQQLSLPLNVRFSAGLQLAPGLIVWQGDNQYIWGDTFSVSQVNNGGEIVPITVDLSNTQLPLYYGALSPAVLPVPSAALEDQLYTVDTAFDIPEIDPASLPQDIDVELNLNQLRYLNTRVPFMNNLNYINTNTETIRVEHRNTAPVTENLSSNKNEYSIGEDVILSLDVSDLEANTIESVIEISSDGFNSITQSIPVTSTLQDSSPIVAEEVISGLEEGAYEWRVVSTETNGGAFCDEVATNLSTVSDTQTFEVVTPAEPDTATLAGIVFLDSNNNQVQDSDELVFTNSTFRITGNGFEEIVTTDQDGRYTITLPFGSYNMEIVESSLLESESVIDIIFNLNVGVDTTDLDAFFPVNTMGLIRTGGR